MEKTLTNTSEVTVTRENTISWYAVFDALTKAFKGVGTYTDDELLKSENEGLIFQKL